MLWLSWASQVILVVKNMPANAEDVRDVGLISGLGRSPGGGHGNPLRILACRIPWTEEPGRSMWSQSQTWQKRLSKHACDYPAKSENLFLSLHVNEHTVQLGHDFFNSPSTLKPLDYSHLGLLQKDCIVGSVAVLLYEHAQLFPWESFPKVKFLIQGGESFDEYWQMTFGNFMQIYIPTRSIEFSYISIGWLTCLVFLLIFPIL